MTSKTFDRVLASAVTAGFMVFSAVVGQMSPARGHDHSRPDLANWFMSLHSKHAGMCCDGSDAMHLNNVEWTTPNGSSRHYRVRIPVNANAYDRARQREEVETMWVEVPDDAVIDDPNLSGTALVWPTYGYRGPTVRCFMPGVEG